jgi:putative ABC transport system substrate-binding protein
MIDRRAFIAGSLNLLAAPLTAHAQQPGRVYRLGNLFAYGLVAKFPYPDDLAFLEGLRAHGYSQGRNLTIELLSAEGKLDRLPELAAELVRRNVDVIYAPTGQTALAAKSVTSKIPIVTCCVRDAVGIGLVTSFARPGGNVTGLTWDVSPESNGKLVALLKEAVPKVSRVAVLWDPTYPGNLASLREAQVAAQALGLTLQPREVRTPDDYSSVFATIVRERAAGLVVLPDLVTHVHSGPIIEFAAKQRLPAVYTAREFVEAGGLMAYGPNLHDQTRRTATYVAKLFEGAKPADLPMEQPARFELVINMKTAKALGLTIPPAVLARADDVIQ